MKAARRDPVNDPPVEMIMQAREFVIGYTGPIPFLAALHTRAIRNPRWVPTDYEAVRIHRYAHKLMTEERAGRTALADRLRSIDRANLPDSLDDPPFDP